eukprot:2287049-Pyramimonas_sp.AAC.1
MKHSVIACGDMLWRALLCDAVVCDALFCQGAGVSGILDGPGDLAAAVCRVGGSGREGRESWGFSGDLGILAAA